MAKASEKADALKRLGGGRWQTRDERFTIEPQSGTWVVVDGEQTDDLGLPLVRGPFGSLGDAKAAIDQAREGEPAVSPLVARAAELQKRSGTAKTVARPSDPAEPEEPKEPRWLTDLAPAQRDRARTLIERLTKIGAPDAEGIAEREIAGNVAATATYAIRRAMDALGVDAKPDEVARLLADGRDADLEISWRLVDGEGRPIVVDAGRSTKRKQTASG
ncbi:MAG: hypothetical protein ACHQ3P_07865 [Candidatus Limnocylindrales bacterium]